MIRMVSTRSGKLRLETMFERYERNFLIGIRLARLRDWVHNRRSDALLDDADYEPDLQGASSFQGEPQSLMSMSLPYVVDVDDEQHVGRVGRAMDAAASITSTAGMERTK